MSEENEVGEEKPKDDLAQSDEFEFYFSFTKPLVLDLPSSEDRAIAAAWVQKLEAEPESEEEKQLRLNYLKLLLFVLQRGRLSGIFKKQPPSGPLQPFPQGFSIIDMGNWMLDQDDGQPCGAGDARCVPYTIEISNDLREFVASQEIPNFGIQMYYAWSSDDPIHKWASFDEEKFPQFILDKIKQLKEIKSDEKSSIGKNGCLTKKKGCDLNLQDKYSKKKVKSPQEIERSQGRSFHTYMGLVGRMGNFNDKCDDDPDKFQRQDPRKVKYQRRTPQKRCPNGGEAEDMMPEEEYDNLVSGLGGLSTQNRKCQCNYPCQHENCPDHPKGGGPQAFEPQPPPGRNGYNMGKGNVESIYCPPGGAKPPSPRNLMEEQCAEQMMPQMRGQSSRSRSGSPTRPNAECPPEDKAGGFPKQSGLCICSTPPCTCPCPRGTSPKATSNANSEKTVNCPPQKPEKQDLCAPEQYGNRLPYPKPPDNCPPLYTSKAQDNCPPMTYTPKAQNNCPPMSYSASPKPPDNCPPMSYTSKAQDNCPPMSYPSKAQNNCPPMSYNAAPKPPDNCPPMSYNGSPKGPDNCPPMSYGSPKGPDNCPPMSYGSPKGPDNCPPMSYGSPKGPNNCPPMSYNASPKGPDNCPPMSYNTSPKGPDNCPPMSYNGSPKAPDNCPPMSYNGSPKGPDNCPPMSYNGSPKGPDNCPPMSTPSGGASNRAAGASTRAGQTEVIHCYDPRNPDPALYEKMDKEWMDLARERGNKRLEADYQNFMSRAQPAGEQNMQNSRRGLFNPLAQSTPIAEEPCGVPSDIPRHAGRYCPPPVRVSSPPLHPNQACDYPEEPNQAYSMAQNQQMSFAGQQYQQSYMECEGEAGAPAPGRSPEAYSQRSKPDPCRKSPPQAMNKSKTYGAGQAGSEGGRMANMASVLQGMKQRTEAHREKCDPATSRRSPTNDAAYYSGNVQAPAQGKPRSQMALDNGGMLPNGCPPRNARSGQQMSYSIQNKQTQQYSPYQDRGYVSLPNAMQMKQCVPPQQPAQQRQPARPPTAAPVNPDNCYPNNQPIPNNQPAFQAFEDECDLDSTQYASLDLCRPQSPGASQPQGMPRSVSPNNGPQASPRGNAQNLMPMMYGEDSQNDCSPQWVPMKTVTPRSFPNDAMDPECRPQTRPQRSSPPRSSPGRSSPPRNGGQRSGSPRSNAGRTPPQDTSQLDCTPSDRATRGSWSTRTASFGSRTPDTSSIKWVTPKIVNPDYMQAPFPGLGRCQEPAPPCPPAPCPPPSNPCPPPSNPCPPPSNPCPPPSNPCPPPSNPCPPPSNPCPPPSNPCPPPSNPCPPPSMQNTLQQRSPAKYGNYPQQAMNAELQFQDELCDEEMADDMGNADMNDMEACDQQTYVLQDEMCEDDVADADFNAYDDEDNDNCDPQNFMAMRSSMDGAEECYDDYQEDMNADDCEPLLPPQNAPMNRPGGGQRNSGQGQRNCVPPPANNRNPNCPDQFSGGMSMQRH